MSDHPPVIRIAVPVPLYRLFDYSIPREWLPVSVGARVRVPFGRRSLIGLVVATGVSTEVNLQKLKPVQEVLDSAPVMDTSLMTLANWIAGYYLAPIGQVYDTLLPTHLRQGLSCEPTRQTVWRISPAGAVVDAEQLLRAPVQRQLLELLKQQAIDREQAIAVATSWRAALKAMVDKGWVLEQQALAIGQYSAKNQQKKSKEYLSSVTLNSQQQRVVDGVDHDFRVHLLHGVTGSGKTEVYLQLAEQAIARGQQALLLVPEIGLTPQFVERVRQRLRASVAVVHSGLTDNERFQAWWCAKEGMVDIVLGTRAAVFTPFKQLGLIAVDEEHDASFKQQDGVRYHARDVAIIRARYDNIPIVLGSATPSLESFANTQLGRYQRWSITQRATGMEPPDIHLIDTRNQRLTDGLSARLCEQITHSLERQQQVMLYINRRGFAAALYCTECAWLAECPRCDAQLTVHQSSGGGVRCHHCGYQAAQPTICPDCQQPALMPLGEGTQRIEQALTALFPAARVLRMDRDSVGRKGELECQLDQIRQHQVDIILGTQMLTKGHDFQGVTLVGVLNADQGLYAADFRGSEITYQQLLQVAGRAGRHQRGSVYIQTSFPDHPLFAHLISQNFEAFAEQTLSERRAMGYPPFGYFALLRAESVTARKALEFLRWCRRQIPDTPEVTVSDAVPAPMERRAGRYRGQLLFKAMERKPLHQTLALLLHVISDHKIQHSVRWSLDVDPQDMY